MTTLTAEQVQDLREEFIEFKINEMTHEDMYAYKELQEFIHDRHANDWIDN
jgi:hypothetical protein